MPQFLNAQEPWELHDTLCICANRYGSEPAAGFFTTFNAFSANERHLFFKNRSVGNTHLAYNNQQAMDRADFVFHAFSIGVHFFGPCTPVLFEVDDQEPNNIDTAQITPQTYQSFWIHTLPRHCGLEFSVGQDVKLSCNSLMAAPGYGPSISGVGAGLDGLSGITALSVYNAGPPIAVTTTATPNYVQVPEIIYSGTQGLPEKRARFQFGTQREPSPIAIPRGEIIEVKLTLSEYARRILALFPGPGSYLLQKYVLHGELDPTEAVTFPSRFGIQVSLYGVREVQQRGQLHA